MARAAWAAWLLVLMCFVAWTLWQILVAKVTDANDGGRYTESCLVSDRISAFPYVLLMFLVCCAASFYGRPGFVWARSSGFRFAAALGVWFQFGCCSAGSIPSSESRVA
ncbi:unnamed protein product [Miscanthus lutarioriparius]|uniref:Uncharacterized protein n=1 Tax=Miscanthus lutarioriparius TaxID=422564 RepID=A0A811MRL4_9POAL|nr:unnamed protein product [Miscanthus lutarioriparius]